MKKLKARDMGRIALFCAVLVVCSWIVIPTVVPFTMQSFAVLLAAAVLGRNKASAVVCLYIILGIIGLPVFSGGKTGIGILMGITGGYIIGFLPCAYVTGALCERIKKRPFAMGCSMALGLLCDYILGAAWFCIAYLDKHQNVTSALVTGIVPFIGTDLLKIVLACAIAAKLQKI